jgi:outer membrane protein
MRSCTSLALAGLGLALLFAPPAAAQLDKKLAALDEALQGIYDGNAVTLEECVAAALAGNPRLGAYEEAVETSQVSRQRAALWNWLPDLSASGNWSRSERTDFDSPVFGGGPSVLIPFPIYDSAGNLLQVSGQDPYVYVQGSIVTGAEDAVSRFESKSASLSTNLTLFSGFSRWAALRRTKADLDADENLLEYQHALLVQDVSNRYMDLVKAKRRVEVAEEAEALALAQLERSETYFELGISTRSDVLQQKVNHQNTKLATVRERNTLANAFVLLAHAMGIPSSRRFDIEVVVPTAEEMLVPELQPLVDQAYQQRLDLEASELNVDGRAAGVTEARSGFWPSVQAYAQYSRSSSESPQSLRLGASENDALTWGVQGRWSLWDRFATREASRQAVAAKRRAEYDLRVAQLNVEAEVVSIHNNLLEAVEAYQVATQTVEQAEEDLRLSEERFRVGAGTSLDVINAQVGLAQARRDVVDAQVDYMKAQQQLRRATGGRI